MNWSQLSTVIWLRWRLTKNQFSRSGKLNMVIAMIGAVIGILIAAGAAVGGVFAGAMGLSKASPMATMLAWDVVVCVFLFMWMIGVVTEIQRSETIDLARMLHLPVSLQGIFVMNYVASLVTFSIIIFVPAVIGLCLGLTWALGPLMLLLIPLALAFIFMVSAWTYCLRGWLVALMVNPRKRRTVIAVLTLSLVLMGQLPNLYFGVFFQKHMRQLQQQQREQAKRAPHRPHRSQGDDSTAVPNTPMQKGADWEHMVPPAWLMAHTYVPLLWLPKGAMELADGDVWPAVFGSLGAFLLGAAGLARAYRSTIRFYIGQETATAAKPVAAAKPAAGPQKKNFMERELPFVGEDTAALALAFFRSLSRATEVKMSLFVNVIILVAFVPLMLLKRSKGATDMTQLFFVTGAVGFTFFGLLQMMFNLFGYDREGFRGLVLSPAARRNILLAKNISIAPVAFGLGAAMLIVVKMVMHLPLLEVAAGLVKLAAIFLLLSVAGNLISIWVPYRVTQGSLKPTKPPFKTVLLIIVTQLLFPVVMIPVFIAPLLGLASEKLGWWPAIAVDGLASIGLLGIAVLVYAITLNGLGDMLERREQKILLVVSREGE